VTALPRRVAGILTAPRSEWTRIAGEVEDVGSLYGSYIAILALVPAVSILVGLARIGGRFLGSAAITTAVTAAMVSYAMALALPLVTAVVLDKLGPAFKADGDMIAALKLVGYSATPVWLAGLLSIVITLSPLVVVGWFWALYLFYVGAPIVMKVPHEQVVPFVLVAVLTVVVVSIVLRAVVTAASIPYF